MYHHHSTSWIKSFTQLFGSGGTCIYYIVNLHGTLLAISLFVAIIHLEALCNLVIWNLRLHVYPSGMSVSLEACECAAYHFHPQWSSSLTAQWLHLPQLKHWILKECSYGLLSLLSSLSFDCNLLAVFVALASINL